MTFKILCLVLFKFGAFFCNCIFTQLLSLFYGRGIGLHRRAYIRDELRFFWTVSAWESEFVVGEFVIAEFFSNARISFTNFLFSSRNSFSSFFSSCSSLFFCPNSLCKSEYILCNKSSFLLNTVFSSVFELFSSL